MGTSISIVSGQRDSTKNKRALEKFGCHIDGEIDIQMVRSIISDWSDVYLAGAAICHEEIGIINTYLKSSNMKTISNYGKHQLRYFFVR